MKTQLIMLDTPIIVSDEEIKDVRGVKGKWHIEKGYIINQFPDYLTDLSECKLIIAGIEGLPLIDWNGLEEEFGFVDVGNLVRYHIENNCRNYDGNPIMDEQTFYEGAKWGFKESQSLNDKKFSLEDMKNLFAKTLENAPTTEAHTRMISDEQYRHHVMDELFNHLTKSLQQPKVFDIGVELLSDNPYDPRSKTGRFEVGDTDKVVIRNNSIKILKKL